MTFTALLAAYYICDAAAQVNQMNAERAVECARTYTQVKLEFLSEDEIAALANSGSLERHQLMLAGYRRFKAFEAANGEAIGVMKTRAREAARSRVAFR